MHHRFTRSPLPLRSLARALTFSCLTALGLSPAMADERVTDFRLDNGLQVVVIEDHRAPVVVQMVWYRVGSADEKPGETGLAHFLEHLMFKGTKTMAPGTFSTTIAANGGNDNAFTSHDYTAYFQRIAADRLPMVMAMEADRMANLVLGEEDVLTERNVVLEERATRVESQPDGLFSEQQSAITYLNHPYGKPVIGWRHELEVLNRDAALAFYRQHYAPDNAVVIIAGDVDPAEVRKLAEEYYGPLAPSSHITARERPQEPPQLGERRLKMHDARVAQPWMMRNYKAPARQSGNQDEAAALTVLARLLGGSGPNSILSRALEFDDATALSARAYYSSLGYDGSEFNLTLVPRPGVGHQEAEAALDAALADFLEKGIDQADFDRVMARIRASEIYALDDVMDSAERYGAALTTGLTVEDVKAWPARLQAVTPEAVMAAARKVLVHDQSVTGWLERGPEAASDTMSDEEKAQ